MEIYSSTLYPVPAKNAVWLNVSKRQFKTLDVELNPIRHLHASLGAHHILHVSRIRGNEQIGRILFPHKKPELVLG